MRVVLLALLIPAAVSAAALDDYYLSKFGENAKAARARALSAVVGQETEYADHAGHAERCRTPLYRSLKRDWPELEPATKNALAKYVSRPLLLDRVTFSSSHFNIHFAGSGRDAPDLTDLDNDQIPDWVEEVAAVFEEVYRQEVTEMGYRPPPVAKYDVYLRDLQWFFGLTFDDGIPRAPSVSAGSYIEIDRAFTGNLFTEGGLYTSKQMLQITAAHEFHHAIQFGYNYYFDMWYAELTSTWIEDEVYGSVNQLYSYLPAYLPQAGTLPLNAPERGDSEYGRWIFNRFLAERHSPALIKDIWGRLGATAAPGDGRDIPMLPIISTAITAGGSTLSDDLLGFAKKLYVRDWATVHAAEDYLIPSVSLEATYSNYPVAMSAINTKIAALPQQTFAYYKFLPSQSAPAVLTLPFAGLPAGVKVMAVKKGKDGSIEEFNLVPVAETITVPSFNSDATLEVQLIISNSPVDPAQAEPPVASAGGGGGCFIATAAYGSYLHPKVSGLRDFRDNHLLTNAPGRLFVSFYYRFSPPVAEVIGEHEWLRGSVRLLLMPLVLTVEHPGGALLVFVLSGGAMVWRLMRRRNAVIRTAAGSEGGRC